MEENKEFMSRPLIEQQLENAGKEIEKLMDVYPCLREICMGLKTQAYPAALFAGSSLPRHTHDTLQLSLLRPS